MQKLKLELNANPVGANCVRLHFEELTLKSQKGITLIALIITIIVMLILVGVTINVALNGGLFSKAEEATTKTKIAQIQEQLTIKKAEILAEYDGKAPADYGITLDDLNLPTELKTQYRSKLIISKDAKLYYDASVVTNTEEQNRFEEMGIQAYAELNEGETYTFTIGELAERGLLLDRDPDVSVEVSKEEFWPSDISEDLKNSTVRRNVEVWNVTFTTYNIKCSDSKYSNLCDIEESDSEANTFIMIEDDGNVLIIVKNEENTAINMSNYKNYEDLEFTISMAEETDVPQEPVEPGITGTAYGTEELAYIITSDNRLILYTGGTAYNGSDMGYSLYTQKLTNHEDYANYTLSEDISESTMFIFNSDDVVNAVSPDKTVIYGLEIGTSLIQTAGSPLTLNESLDVKSIINSVF